MPTFVDGMQHRREGDARYAWRIRDFFKARRELMRGICVPLMDGVTVGADLLSII